MGSENENQPENLSPEERAALVNEWRKNRHDLSWKPLEGRELDRFLPLRNKLMSVVVVGTLFVGVFLLLFLWSSPQETKEINAAIIVAGKPKEDGTTVIVAIPGEPERQMIYRGKETLRNGQEIVLEQVSVMGWTSYRFKDQPEIE